MSLRLRPYQLSDEARAIALHVTMLADEFHFLHGWDPTWSWPEFLQFLDDQRRGDNLAPGHVRGYQLAAEVDGDIIGRVSLRFALNEWLLERGGHIGYGVAPAYRQKGYATEMLRQALIVIRAEGVNDVLVTCAENNVGSYKTIERNGGVLESIAPPIDGDPVSVRRYWIN